MGLIKAGMGALGGTLADQWKEFFYCEALGKDVLVTKGQKRITGRSSNTKGRQHYFQWKWYRSCRRTVYVDRRTGQGR